MTPQDPPSERDERVARLLRSAADSERAPMSLRENIERMRAEAGQRRGRSLAPAFMLRYAAVMTAAVAGLAVVLALALGGGASPSIAQAAALAAHGPVAPAPAPDPLAPASLLKLSVGDLQFPNWEHQGWKASGKRIDHLGGRTVATVYYANRWHKIAYSIVSAPALKRLRTGGEPYATITQNGRTVVIWEKRNHTCILSAKGLSAPQLWRLAAVA